MCRFSDAGNDDLTTRSGSQRPKSAKARSEHAAARLLWLLSKEDRTLVGRRL
jgi:hypothetical protein